MTSKQRDELATMAGGKIEHFSGKWRSSYVYHFKNESYPSDKWHPKTSLDDCRPLLEEIKRRDLRKEFVVILADIRHPAPTQPESIVWWAICEVTSADIVAAFVKTIEEADRKEGE